MSLGRHAKRWLWLCLMVGVMLAWLAGGAAALLHLAGALKSIPLIGALPIDFTIFSAALALPLLALCAITRRWVVAPEIGLPLGAIGMLWLWLVFAGCWSASGPRPPPCWSSAASRANRASA